MRYACDNVRCRSGSPATGPPGEAAQGSRPTKKQRVDTPGVVPPADPRRAPGAPGLPPSPPGSAPLLLGGGIPAAVDEYGQPLETRPPRDVWHVYTKAWCEIDPATLDQNIRGREAEVGGTGSGVDVSETWFYFLRAGQSSGHPNQQYDCCCFLLMAATCRAIPFKRASARV